MWKDYVSAFKARLNKICCTKQLVVLGLVGLGPADGMGWIGSHKVDPWTALWSPIPINNRAQCGATSLMCATPLLVQATPLPFTAICFDTANFWATLYQWTIQAADRVVPPTLPLYGRVGGTDHLITTPAKRKEVTRKIMSKIGGYQILEVLTSGGPIQDPRYTREVYSLPLMEPAGSFAPQVYYSFPCEIYVVGKRDVMFGAKSRFIALFIRIKVISWFNKMSISSLTNKALSQQTFRRVSHHKMAAKTSRNDIFFNCYSPIKWHNYNK